MSKLFTLFLVLIIIASLLLIGFAGYVVWSTFNGMSEPTSIEGELIDGEIISDDLLVETEESNQIEGPSTDTNSDTETDSDSEPGDTSPLLSLSNALLEPAFILLTYHHIDPDLLNNPITITPKRFDEHISALQRSEYKPISYDDLTRFLSISEETRRLLSLSRYLTPEEEAWIEASIDFVNRLPREGYHITFDDGYQSFYTFAFPKLRDARISSTFFVIVRSSFKETQTAPDWINYPHVTWEELRIIQRQPFFEIQSHTYSLHSYEPGNGQTIPSLIGRIYRADLGRLETDEEFTERIYQDMMLSKSYLENRLRPHLANGLSYPYGAYNDTVIEMAEKANLQYLFTNQPGLVTYETSPMQIPRVNAGAPEITATELLNTVDDLFFRRSF